MPQLGRLAFQEDPSQVGEAEDPEAGDERVIAAYEQEAQLGVAIGRRVADVALAQQSAQALAAAQAGRLVEGMATEETTLSLKDPLPSGYSNTALARQYERLIIAVRQALSFLERRMSP